MTKTEKEIRRQMVSDLLRIGWDNPGVMYIMGHKKPREDELQESYKKRKKFSLFRWAGF